MERKTKGLDKLHNRENFDVQMEDNANAHVLEESGKCRRNNRKNRHYSPSAVPTPQTIPPVDNAPGESVPEICSSQSKVVKYYPPLSLYLKLDLEPLELYNLLSLYVLHPEQLKGNGFPLESPNNPGKAIFKGGPRLSLLNNSNERICSRCIEKFTVLEDGSYHSETTCCYHSGKRQMLGEIYNAGAYSCCGDPGISNGCTVSTQHVSAHGCLDNVQFVKTRENWQNPKLHVYALDCEMCYTIQGLEVTRVSIVGIDGLEVYDSFVIPENPIIDYNTTYSGITTDHLKNVTTTLADVQAFLLELLTSSTILVGHGLENDLRALHLIHETIADTSIIFSSQERKSRKPSLRTLASNYLEKTIQQGSCGHDSVEDARTCMELVLRKIQNDKSGLLAISANLYPNHHYSSYAYAVLTVEQNHYLQCLNYCSWVPPAVPA